MELVYADIKLTRTADVLLSQEGFLEADKIRSMEVNALVDTGAYMLVINENIRHQLDLKTIEKKDAELADGTLTDVEIVGPVEVGFKNRRTTVDAVVFPGKDVEILLGAIPLEGLDVQIDPKNQQLILPPDRPYVPRVKIK